MTFSVDYHVTLASLHRSLQKARRELDAATPLSREWTATRREMDELHRTVWLLEQAQRAARHDIDIHRHSDDFCVGICSVGSVDEPAVS